MGQAVEERRGHLCVAEYGGPFSEGEVGGDEFNERLGPEDAIRHVTRKHLNIRIESDHAALKRLLRPMWGFWDCECWT